MTVRVICGDAIERLRDLPAGSVHVCVTSVPYFGLRDYGVDRQIGLELTPAEWCAKLVAVFREVRRVLRSDGLLWLNCGSSYANSGRSGSVGYSAKSPLSTGSRNGACAPGNTVQTVERAGLVSGYKPGDLMILPVMLAEVLRADGWWLRDSIIWAKTSCMPEAVRGWVWEQHRIKDGADGVACSGCMKCAPNNGLVLRKGSWRHTSSYEYVFMLAKSADYFADGEAVKEIAAWPNGSNAPVPSASGRNPRNVWRIGSEALSAVEVDGEAIDHFAAFPRALVRKCLLVSLSAKGACTICGAPWTRVVERFKGDADAYKRPKYHQQGVKSTLSLDNGSQGWAERGSRTNTLGWRPTCVCGADPGPGTVIDPFAGSGTTGIVADEMGQDAILIELSPKYARLAEQRIANARARRMLGDVEKVMCISGQLSLL